MPRPIGRKPRVAKSNEWSLRSSACIEAVKFTSLSKPVGLTNFAGGSCVPNGRHDDQVDSLSQFLAWAAERAAVSTEMHMFLTEVYEDGTFHTTYAKAEDGGKWQ